MLLFLRPGASKGDGSVESFWLSALNLAPSILGLGVPLKENSAAPRQSERGAVVGDTRG